MTKTFAVKRSNQHTSHQRETKGIRRKNKSESSSTTSLTLNNVWKSQQHSKSRISLSERRRRFVPLFPVLNVFVLSFVVILDVLLRCRYFLHGQARSQNLLVRTALLLLYILHLLSSFNSLLLLLPFSYINRSLDENDYAKKHFSLSLSHSLALEMLKARWWRRQYDFTILPSGDEPLKDTCRALVEIGTLYFGNIQKYRKIVFFYLISR